MILLVLECSRALGPETAWRTHRPALLLAATMINPTARAHRAAGEEEDKDYMELEEDLEVFPYLPCQVWKGAGLHALR